MALGIPVVTSNVGALPEVVGDAGILVDPADVAGLAGAIERVTAEPELAARMRNAAWTGRGQFSWPASARALLGAYTDALPPRRLAAAAAAGTRGMRIGVDTRELMGSPTGVGRYLAELLGAWADQTEAVSGRHEFVLYGSGRAPVQRSPRASTRSGRRFVWCVETAARPGNSWLSHRPQPETPRRVLRTGVYRAIRCRSPSC